MILLSAIINEFEDSFLTRYKNMVLAGHRKALRAMKHCRKEYGPHMLARCTNHHWDTGIVPIARTMKIGNGLKINWRSFCRLRII